MKLSHKPNPPGPARREPRSQQLGDIYLTYEGQATGILIRSPDLSVHGMFVNTSTHFPEGAVVNIRFRLTHSDVEVQTRGEVRYCLAGIGIGVEFIGIGPEAEKAIRSAIGAAVRSRRPRKRTKV